MPLVCPDEQRFQGLSLTAFRAACRHVGVNKWPYARSRSKSHSGSEGNDSESKANSDNENIDEFAKRRDTSNQSSNVIKNHIDPEGSLELHFRWSDRVVFSPELDSLMNEALDHVELNLTCTN
uniref:RWP-RK domain-containing protein n=1 Tax=Guillardia theta TaxID=55529 RepID=A0A7S4NSU7_GUITH|mmetsp:Transcript_30847/g.99168  ORF Transcript_30847/g.99168 Transcript_30847/m.99168 type:complete len:123 (+) Transcript_30847:240-608(+)